MQVKNLCFLGSMRQMIQKTEIQTLTWNASRSPSVWKHSQNFYLFWYNQLFFPSKPSKRFCFKGQEENVDLKQLTTLWSMWLYTSYIQMYIDIPECVVKFYGDTSSFIPNSGIYFSLIVFINLATDTFLITGFVKRIENLLLTFPSWTTKKFWNKRSDWEVKLSSYF
jgi:hypothetical protein